MRRANSRATAAALLGAVVAATAIGIYLTLPYVYLVSGELAPATAAAAPVPKPSLFNSLGSSQTYPVVYPSAYGQLANFTLAQINKDREAAGLGPVALSRSVSGQQHADSMLFFGYFSHWDTQGLKPYMRYSLLNGSGAVEENVAYEATRLPAFTTIGIMESAIARLENQMMYNDSQCCENGHRDNILDPLHDAVSLGIAYNSTRLYLVQDFENAYLSLDRPVVTGDTVTIVGNSSIPLDNVQVVVYQDPTPTNLTDSQLASPPYSGYYDAGDFVGGVVQPCLIGCEGYQNGLTISANRWSVTNSTVEIQFHITKFVNIYGSGVYTVYLEVSVNGTQEPVFLQSIFVS